MPDIKPAVVEIIAALFQLDPSTIGDECGPDVVEQWDSLQHLNLVLDLEQRFTVQLEPEEIARMQSVRSITDILSRKLNSTPPA